MSKIKSREERNQSYNDFFGLTQEILATDKRNQGSSITPERDLGYSAQDKIGKSKYDEGFIPGLDFFTSDDPNAAKEIVNNAIDENRAQLQPASEKWLSGLGRVLAKTGTETMKGLGYVGGAVPALINQDITDMTNNFFVEAFQELEDASKEAFPVYTREEIENGSFARQIWSPEFWATEGADGLGFLLSAVASGGIVSGLSKGAQIGAKTAQLLNKGNKMAGMIDNAIITGTQTFLESAAETKGMVDNLKSHWASKQTEFGYDSGKKDKEGLPIYYSQEEVDSLIGNAAVSTLALNALFLAGPNALQTKYLFGKGEVPTGLLSKLDNTSTETMKESLSKIVPWKQFSSQMVEKGTKSAGAEAFQELSQFAIEDYESKKGKAMTNSNLIEGLADGYYEGLTTIEGHKSMFLGAVLGVGPAAFSAYKDTKAQIKNTKGLVELLNKSSAAFKEEITAVYNKNEDGSLKLDENGKPDLNVPKLLEILDSANEDNVLAKMYGAGVVTGDTDATRRALNDMTLRNLYPYLGIEGGSDIWENHLSAFSEIMENDHKSLGFKDKAEYFNYMKSIGETAKIEYAKVKDRGPSFYGLSTKNLNIEGLESTEIQEELGKITSQIEYQAVRYKIFKDRNDARLENINDELIALEKEDNKRVLETDETLNETFEATKEIRAEHEGLTNLKKRLEKDTAILKTEYNKLFDKEEQQKVFDFRIKEKAKSKKNIEVETQESAETKSEETPEEVEKTDDELLIEDFYNNLRNKGYDIEKGKEDGTDFGKGVVTLKDNKDNIYRVIKKFNKNTNTNDYHLLNIDTGNHQKFTLDLVKKLGFNSSENILSKEEFKKYDNTKKILKKNAERLTSLRKVISKHFNSRKAKKDKIEALKEELSNYQKELEIGKELDPNLTIDSMIEEIITLESKIESVENELKSIQEDIVELDRSLGLLLELQSELRYAIENTQEYSFGIKLNDLKTKLEEGDFETNIDVIEESISINNTLESELISTLSKMKEALDKSYELLSELSDIDNILSDVKTSTGLANKLKRNYPEIVIDGNVISGLNRIQIKKLLNDPEVRRELIERVRAEKQELMAVYGLQKDTVTKLNKELSNVQKELKKLLTNKVLTLKYDKLKLNYKSLKYINDIAIIDEVDEKDLQYLNVEEQDDTAINEEVIRKNNAFSTSSQIFKGKRDSNGNYITERYPKGHAKAGQKVLNDNYKQGARWDETMANIPLDKLDQYQVRFVNNTQLEELGQIPPSNEEGDLYAVLYSKLDGAPYKHDNGLVFTGVANTSSMFGEDWTSIEIERIPEYESYLNKIIDADNPVVFNNKSYTDVEILKKDIIEVVKDNYDNFRKRQLEKVNKGEKVYSAIKDISAGIPQYSEVKHNPKEVLPVGKIIIPNSNTVTKKNNAVMEVQSGRAYVELENGQIVRVLNNKIMDLSDTEKGKVLNKIITFISLAKHVENANFRQEFFFEGKNVKEKIPLVGDSKKGGILDHFINWGISKDKPTGIRLFAINKNDFTEGYELRFKLNGKSSKIKVNDLFDKNGKVKDYNDTSLIELVEFLENKYLNINVPLLNKTNQSLKIPKGYNPLTKTITYDKVDTMTDYYLDNNYVYTNIKKYDKELDEIPNFVNRYVSYEKKVVPELPKIAEVKPVTVKSNTLKGLKKNVSTEADFFNSVPIEMYDNIEEDSGHFKGLLDSFNQDNFVENNKEEKKEDCPIVKVPGANKKRRNKK